MNHAKSAKLVQFGRGGDTVYYGDGSTGTGYGNPDRPHAADLSRHTIPDGTPAIDVRAAVETDEGMRWAIRGPMVDVDLSAGAVAPCPEPSPIFAVAVADNQFGTLLSDQRASRASGESRGPLDSVSIREYLAGWRDHGARIGCYRDGQIVWG